MERATTLLLGLTGVAVSGAADGTRVVDVVTEDGTVRLQA